MHPAASDSGSTVALGIALLGCTGSIGKSALAVLERHPDEFRVVALAARRNAPELETLAQRYHPAITVLVDEGAGSESPLRGNGGFRVGREALLEAAAHPDVDVVLNAVVGAAGLEASLAALEAGKRLALANKESLVAGGPLVTQALARGGGELIPVDSEHSAILQCLCGAPERSVRRLILTASGGPFRDWPVERLERVTREDALRHPTWEMGAKVTVDSASLANKALEVIEAHFLFGVEYASIEVVVHPQSIVHSMVEFVDGSVLAQMGFPNMELPILYALTHPRRLPDAGTRCFDPLRVRSLSFEPVDDERFPAFRLGVQAGQAGGTAPAVYNAANEVAVAGFLSGQLRFNRIADVIGKALDSHVPVRVDSLATVLEADRGAREVAAQAMRAQC
jgi:1-deoxy-D-xylulose-5-phosphate reductoisomerase